MTDDKDKRDEEAPEAQAEGPRGGERLAAARREKQISILEIAKELHVEEAKIRALENNDFDVLGAPVFAKGHLKKYAQLVGINHDDVLADYYRLTRSQEMPPVVVKRQKPSRELSPGPWIAVVGVLALLALAYWLLVERPFTTQFNATGVALSRLSLGSASINSCRAATSKLRGLLRPIRPATRMSHTPAGTLSGIVTVNVFGTRVCSPFD